MSCICSYSIKSVMYLKLLIKSVSIKSILYLQLLHQVCHVSAATSSSLSCICSNFFESVLYLQLLHKVCQVGPLFADTPLNLSRICSFSIKPVLYLQLLHQVCPLPAATTSYLSCICSSSIKFLSNKPVLYL